MSTFIIIVLILIVVILVIALTDKNKDEKASSNQKEIDIYQFQENQKLRTNRPISPKITGAEIYKESYITKNPSIKVDGKTFCITGNSNIYEREELIYMIEAKGGIIKRNVVLTLDYLVVCEKGSTDFKFGSHGLKVDRAIQWNKDNKANISIIREDQLIEFL